MVGKSLFSVSEAAELLHASESSVRRWTRYGLLRATRVGPKLIRYHEADLERFLAAGESSNAAPSHANA